MKLEEEVILGERLLTIRATPEEMQEHIEGRKLRLNIQPHPRTLGKALKGGV